MAWGEPRNNIQNSINDTAIMPKTRSGPSAMRQSHHSASDASSQGWKCVLEGFERTQADMIKRLQVMGRVDVPAKPRKIAVQRLSVQKVLLRDPEYCDASSDCARTPSSQPNGTRAAVSSGFRGS